MRSTGDYETDVFSMSPQSLVFCTGEVTSSQAVNHEFTFTVYDENLTANADGSFWLSSKTYSYPAAVKVSETGVGKRTPSAKRPIQPQQRMLIRRNRRNPKRKNRPAEGSSTKDGQGQTASKRCGIVQVRQPESRKSRKAERESKGCRKRNLLCVCLCPERGGMQDKDNCKVSRQTSMNTRRWRGPKTAPAPLIRT